MTLVQPVGHPDALDSGSFAAAVLGETVDLTTPSTDQIVFDIGADAATGVNALFWFTQALAQLTIFPLDVNGQTIDNPTTVVSWVDPGNTYVPLQNLGGGFRCYYQSMVAFEQVANATITSYYKLPWSSAYLARQQKFAATTGLPPGDAFASAQQLQAPFYDQVALAATTDQAATLRAHWAWPDPTSLTAFATADEVLATTMGAGALFADIPIRAPGLYFSITNDDPLADAAVGLTAHYARLS